MIPPLQPEHELRLAALPAAIREIVVYLRTIIIEEAPATAEIIYNAPTAPAATGYTFTGLVNDFFVHIAAHPTHVNLGFNNGAALPDPGRALRGEGMKTRHLRISSLNDAERPLVRRFVQEAASRAKRPNPFSLKPPRET
jgi:hypothetical protein